MKQDKYTLINLSNHPHSKWSEGQREAALAMCDEIVDIPFPDIDPQYGEDQIDSLVDEYLEKIKAQEGAIEYLVVHIMGEMNFTFNMVARLKSHGIRCVASTSKRMVKEMEDGQKLVTFDFVRFRNY